MLSTCNREISFSSRNIFTLRSGRLPDSRSSARCAQRAPLWSGIDAGKVVVEQRELLRLATFVKW